MRLRLFSLCIASLFAITATPGLLLAQLPGTTLNTVFPPGAKQGATVDVTVSGNNIDVADRLLFSHPGITATIKTQTSEFLDPTPIAGAFEVKVAGDVPPGIYEARVAGSYGVSNPRAFVVGTGDEVMDNNANRTLETAQELAVGATVNGKAEASQTDYYKLTLKKGQRVLARCAAQRIDSRLDPVLTIHTTDGAQLAINHDYSGLDAFLDFTAPADGDYLLAVRDFLFAGGAEHLYRLNVHAQPHIDFVLPNSIPAGATAEVTVYGRNLPGGKPSPIQGADGSTLEMLAVSVKAPGEGESATGDYVYLPSADLQGFEHRHAGLVIPLFVSRAPSVAVESGDNDKPTGATAITAPTEISGQFFPENDVDYFQFEAKQSEVYWIEVISHRLGLESDPNLVVYRVDKDAQGAEQEKEVAYVDDPGDRNARVATDFDTSTDDPSYRLAVPADGVYRLRIADHFGSTRSDPRIQYRLVVRKESPDFNVVVQTKELKVANGNQVPVYSPQIRKGDVVPITVSLQRLDGFTGDVKVTAEGLPASVTCPAVTLGANQTAATLMLVATENAEPWTGAVKVVAEAAIDGKSVKHSAPVANVIWGTDNRTQTPATFRLTRDIMLSVIGEEAPATVTVGDAPMYDTSLGAKLELPIKVARRAGHADDLKLTAVDAANEFKPADVTVAKDKQDGNLTIDVKANTKPGRYTFYLRSDTKVKYAGKQQVIATAEAAQKKLDEAVKSTADDAKAKTDSANKAKTEATAAAAELTKADAALKTAQTAQQAAAQKAEAAKQAVEKAKAENKEDAVKAAEEAATQANTALAEADKALAAANAALAEATKKRDATAKTQTDADAALKQAQELAKRATDAKKKADTDLANLQKANAAKDVNFAVYSNPIVLNIAAAPINVSTEASAELKPDGKVSVPVKIEKLYGFDDALDITTGLPNGVGGISVGKLQIAKGSAEGMLEFSANAKPTAGDHVIKILAKGKFNNVNIEASTEITLKVSAPEPAK